MKAKRNFHMDRPGGTANAMKSIFRFTNCSLFQALSALAKPTLLVPLDWNQQPEQSFVSLSKWNSGSEPWQMNATRIG